MISLKRGKWTIKNKVSLSFCLITDLSLKSIHTINSIKQDCEQDYNEFLNHIQYHHSVLIDVRVLALSVNL